MAVSPVLKQRNEWNISGTSIGKTTMRFDHRDSLAALAMIRRDRPRSAWLRLLGQVLQLAEGQGELVRHGERTWASATFSGVRHSIVLSFSGCGAVAVGERFIAAVAVGERFIAALDEHEFDIRGQLVADASVIEVSHDYLPEPRLVAAFELLLLEDI